MSALHAQFRHDLTVIRSSIAATAVVMTAWLACLLIITGTI